MMTSGDDRRDPEEMAREMVEQRAVTVRPEQPSSVVLWGSNDPHAMVLRMGSVATALGDAIKRRGMSVKIGPREYVMAEGWSLAGAMIGIFPHTLDVEEIRDGEDYLIGFRARVDLISKDGDVVGGAMALCTRDEERWADRDWNQIASMAQTRAMAKAYRGSLGFIMSMAGYAPTPAEEMDGIEPPDAQPRRPRRQTQATARDAAPKAPTNADIKGALEAKALRLSDVAGALELPEDQRTAEGVLAAMRAWMVEQGQTLDELLTGVVQYMEVMATAETAAVDA